jgi:hypothetical protein
MASSATVSLPYKRLLAELAVIVAGVLIALASDAWWQRRQEQTEARDYLEQLLVDFQETDRRLRGTIEGDATTLESVHRVVDRANRGVYPPPDSLELPTRYDQFEPLTGTLTALVESGDLRLIRNDSLRFELVAFLSLLDVSQQILRHTEVLIWNSTEHVAHGRARHSQSATRRAAGAASGWGEIDVQEALNDPEIMSALYVQAVASQVRTFSLSRLNEPVTRIIHLLQAELE